MKKLLLLSATLALLVTPLALSRPANAAGTCPVGSTGPNSHNLCEVTTTYKCVIDNNNVFVFDNNNHQVATTGSATSSDNTGAGSSTTGSAGNTNDVTFTTKVTNPTTCTVTATVAPITPVVTPPVQPSAAATPKAVAAPKAAALPNTATTSPAMLIASLIGVLGIGVIVTRVGIAAYGHFKA